MASSSCPQNDPSHRRHFGVNEARSVDPLAPEDMAVMLSGTPGQALHRLDAVSSGTHSGWQSQPVFTASIRRVPLSTSFDPAVDASSTLRLAGVGTHVVVNVSGSRSAELLPILHQAWHRCIESATSQEQVATRPVTVSLRATGEQPESSIDVTSESVDDLMTATTQTITGRLIAEQTGRILMFHAGAVAHPTTNRAVIYVAAGGTGKTTLTRLLGTRYRYLTDETAGVDAEHRVHPYPKPLSIRVPGNRYKNEAPPDELGLLPADGPAPVARILLLDRADSYPAEPQLQPTDPFDAMMMMVPQTSALSRLDRGLHQLAALIQATGGVLTVRYREAASLQPLIAELIGDPE